MYYGRTNPGYLDVFVVFQGTDWSQFGDVLANATWFTAFLVRDEYDAARDVFLQVRERAGAEAAADEKVRYVALGHSLGGGLAQHIAFGFPCVTAVVADASIVISRHSYKKPIPDPQIIHLGDRGEIFTYLRERRELGDPVSTAINWIGGLFDGFMPGGRTTFYTFNATDVATGPTDLWQLFLAQHSMHVFAGAANDMLLETKWDGQPGYQPFRLRCLSRLSRSSCAATAFCSSKDDELRRATGYDFGQMCRRSMLQPPP